MARKYPRNWALALVLASGAACSVINSYDDVVPAKGDIGGPVVSRNSGHARAAAAQPRPVRQGSNVLKADFAHAHDSAKQGCTEF